MKTRWGDSSPAELRDRLRGDLPAENPGARGLEHVARNPECVRLRVLTIVGITPATAANKLHGVKPSEGMSPFALTRGRTFEQRLFEDGAARLLDLYRGSGRLDTAECKVANVTDLAPGSRPLDLEKRQSDTHRILKAKLSRDPLAPNLVIKPRLAISLLDVGHAIEPDALVATDDEPFYRPIEIKSYPDRAGKTDPADLRSIRRQAAVGVIALRHAITRIGAPNPETLVPARGDLVLTSPGSFTPKLHATSLLAEVDSIERALATAPASLKELADLLGPGASLADEGTLQSIPAAYRQNCREHCALAVVCKREAILEGNPSVLGDQAREELAAAGSIGRALELMNGTGRPPLNDAEEALRSRLTTGAAEHRRALDDAS